MGENETALDLLERWYTWWFTSDSAPARMPDGLHVETALALTQAGRTVAMGDWTPPRDGDVPRGRLKRCPTCSAPRPDLQPFQSDPCIDPWHSMAPADPARSERSRTPRLRPARPGGTAPAATPDGPADGPTVAG